MYERLVKQFHWGGFNNSSLYFDETNTRMVMNFRNNYARLAEALLQKGDTNRCIITLDKCVNEFPSNVVKLSYFAIPIIDIYLKAGEIEKGETGFIVKRPRSNSPNKRVVQLSIISPINMT